MPITEQIAVIAGKKLEGRATPEELEQLQRWLGSDVAHSREYDQMVSIWTHSAGGTLGLPAFDTAAAWGRIDARIAAGVHAAAPVKSLAFYTRRIAAAAAVIALVATGWLIWNKNHSRWERLEAISANQSFQLPDGSTVELRKGSSLEYPPVFDNPARTVRLSGEAFFRVQHNERQPFRVSAAHTSVEVLGTAFLIRSEAAADEVVVATGKVSVTDRQQTANKVVLEAGQKTVLRSDVFQGSKVTDSNYMAWKTGVLEFKATPIARAFEDIGRYYGIVLELAPTVPPAARTAITVRFDNEPFENALEELQQISGLRAKKEDGRMVFYQK